MQHLINRNSTKAKLFFGINTVASVYNLHMIIIDADTNHGAISCAILICNIATLAYGAFMGHENH